MGLPQLVRKKAAKKMLAVPAKQSARLVMDTFPLSQSGLARNGSVAIQVLLRASVASTLQAVFEPVYRIAAGTPVREGTPAAKQP